MRERSAKNLKAGPRARSDRLRALRGRNLRFEGLEERRLLAITVTTLVDQNNGVNVGGISLREAIAVAAPSDTIIFAPSLFNGGPATTQLLLGSLVIDKPLTITGPGQDLLTIDSSQNFLTADDVGGIFRITSGDSSDVFDVGISGISMFNSHTAYFGGAIFNVEHLTLTGCSITSCSSGSGGAIDSLGDLNIVNCNITGNLANYEGGGISVSGKLVVQNSEISGNTTTGGFGGGIASYYDMTITSSVISNNFASTTGGGISISRGNLVISNSTLSGNTAGTIGGGLYDKGILFPVASTVTIQNSAITSNTAGTAGGLSVAYSSLSLSQVTIGDNRAATAAGLETFQSAATVRYSTIANNEASQFGGGVMVVAGSLLLDGSIVAKNTGTLAPDIAPLFNPTLTLTYDLIGSNQNSGLPASPGLIPDASGNFIGNYLLGGIDPLFGQLATHGGTTANYSLLPGSMAINQGNASAVAGVGTVLQTDQRGTQYVRVAGGRIDIGSYESQTLTPLSLVVDTLVDEDDGNYAAGDLSLREAIRLANERQNSVDTISFAPALTAGPPVKIVLAQGQLTITDSVIINGPGSNKLTIDASGNDLTPNIRDGQGTRIVLMSPNDVLLGMSETIHGLTLTGGDDPFTNGGGAIAGVGDLTIDSSVLTNNHALGAGGAISLSSGNLNVSSSTLSGNFSDSNGGAIYLLGNATVANSTVSGNSATNQGGAIYVTKSIDSDSELDLISTTIEGNTAAIGGGIAASGGGGFFSLHILTLNVVQSTISGNNTNGAGFGTGGGIYTQWATTAIDNSTISGNTSASAGAGMTFYNSGVTIRNSTITKNSAQSGVSGIHTNTSTDSHIQIQSSIIAGNVGVNSDLDASSPSSFVSLGYNLIGPGLTSPFNAPGDHVSTDAKLGPLTNNGGPTKTHALLAGSPAIDMGDPAAVAGLNGIPANDQRGAPYTRVFDGDGIGGARIDIGAFELQTAATAASGDYNHNGRVDAADYVLWRNTKGTSVPASTGADGDGDGTIGQGDYTVWRFHFGNVTAGSGAGEARGTVLAASEALLAIEESADIYVLLPESSAIQSAARSLFLPGQSVRPKTILEEPLKRISIKSRDDALLAWLLARSGDGTGSFAPFEDVPSHRESAANSAAAETEMLFAGVSDPFGR